MAATVSTALDFHFAGHHCDSNRSVFFIFPTRKKNHSKRFTLSRSFCKSSTASSSNAAKSTKKRQSLSEQLGPLSTTILPNPSEEQTHVLSKPNSIWVNPTKAKRSVLSLQRHKRSSYEHNPQIRELRAIANKLSGADISEEAFISALEEIQLQPSRENALLILNSLKPWQKALCFFNWVKAQNSFPMETIFYNVMMKSLRFGKQYQIIDDLANEMINDGIELDNVTYSTIITCAKRCNQFEKAIEWFERMYKTGLMPDEITYSAILDVYGKLGKVEEVLSLYERGTSSGWKPDPVAFSVLAKMFGEAGDYDGINYVLQEMKSLGVKPNLVVYNSLLEAAGKAGKPGFARNLFEEMIESGITPNEKTLTSLVKIYGKARWARDAIELWDRMNSSGWPRDFILCNTLLNMCADLGLEEEAEKLFADMKGSRSSKPDGWSYTAMLNIHGSGGNVERAMELFEEMAELGIEINVMGCTCLIQCLGKAKRIDDLVRVFEQSVLRRGVKPDDRLCGCLLSVISMCEKAEELDRVSSCLQLAKPELLSFIKSLENDEEDEVRFEAVKEGFRRILSETQVEARRPFCNCLIDICRNRNLHGRAHELLYLGSLFGLYPALHSKNAGEWCLDVRSLSVGAAKTALEEWMGTVSKMLRRNEELPEVFLAQTGAGTHRFSQGLASSFAAHASELGAPFKPCEDKAGWFAASKQDLKSWIQFKPLSSLP